MTDDILTKQQHMLLEFADKQAKGYVDIHKMYAETPRPQLIKTIYRLAHTLSGQMQASEVKDNEIALWRAFATAAADRMGGVLHIPVEQLAELHEDVEEKATKGAVLETHDDGSVTLTVRNKMGGA